jgi:cell wall-associated NlpC family hydrolase
MENMKKAIFILVISFVGCLSMFARNIDRSKYKPIDPVDYELSVKQVKSGTVRQYKSTVLFSLQSGSTCYFKSLDGNTSISMDVAKRFASMTRNQKVTVYYTAAKNIYTDIDSLVLDDIEYENTAVDIGSVVLNDVDYKNTTEVKQNSVGTTDGTEKSPAGMRESILYEAEQYIDKPYLSPPGVPENFDCSGFVSYVFSKTTTLKLPASTGAYKTVGEEISFAEAEPGDLLLFVSVPGGNKIDHVAMLYRKSASGELRGSLLIHAVSIPAKSATVKGNSGTSGVKITELGKSGTGNWKNEYFLSRFLTCRRVIQ